MSSRVNSSPPVAALPAVDSGFQRFGEKPKQSKQEEKPENHTDPPPLAESAPLATVHPLRPDQASGPVGQVVGHAVGHAVGWTASFLALFASVKKIGGLQTLRGRRAYTKFKKDQRARIRKGATLDHEAK